jgi:hypothetical protein
MSAHLLSSEQKAFVKHWSGLDSAKPGVYGDRSMPARRSGRTEAVLQLCSDMLSRNPEMTIVFYTQRLDAPDRFHKAFPSQYSNHPGDGRNVHVMVAPEMTDDNNDRLVYSKKADVTIIHNMPARPCPDGGRVLYVGRREIKVDDELV